MNTDVSASSDTCVNICDVCVCVLALTMSMLLWVRVRKWMSVVVTDSDG